MRSRRVLVLRLGVWGLGLEPKSASVRKRKHSQAFASVRKRSQAFASVRKRSQAFASVRKRSPCVRKRPRPKIVAKRRTVVAFGLAWYVRVSEVSTVSGIGGSWYKTRNCRHFWTCVVCSRVRSVNRLRDRGGSWLQNAELSSLLDLRGVFACQKCQQSQGSGASWARSAELLSLN